MSQVELDGLPERACSVSKGQRHRRICYNSLGAVCQPDLYRCHGLALVDLERGHDVSCTSTAGSGSKAAGEIVDCGSGRALDDLRSRCAEPLTGSVKRLHRLWRRRSVVLAHALSDSNFNCLSVLYIQQRQWCPSIVVMKDLAS